MLSMTGIHPAQQWVSFYSGDATSNAVCYGAGLALAIVRGRSAAHVRTLAWVGGAVTATGSLLRVAAYMPGLQNLGGRTVFRPRKVLSSYFL